MSLLQLEETKLVMGNRCLVGPVSLMLSRGSFIALLGPNGSGKTTLLRILAGLWSPTEGRVLWKGRDLGSFSRRELARFIAFVPQDTSLTFPFTVREIVTMGRHPHLGPFEKESPEDRRIVQKALEQARVAHLAERLVTEISGGERQRVMIARSLATQAECILLDEPTANLDIAHALDILALCRTMIEEGKMIVVATHDLNAALRYATQVVVLKTGKVIAQGIPSTVLNREVLNFVFDVCVEQLYRPEGTPVLFFQRKENANRTKDKSTDGAGHGLSRG